MIEGNGHPYSWSAIFNGFDPDEMAKCPYPVIPAYLSREPKESLQVPDVRVTHIWTDDPSDAERVARAALIPHPVSRPEDVIGKVDAVIIPTDKGEEHYERARMFVEAGLPLFIDKPLVDNERDLKAFGKWVAEGRAILSSSCMRYAKEFLPYRESTREFGTVRFATVTTPKSWNDMVSTPWKRCTLFWAPDSFRHAIPGQRNATSSTSATGRAPSWWRRRLPT